MKIIFLIKFYEYLKMEHYSFIEEITVEIFKNDYNIYYKKLHFFRFLIISKKRKY